MKKSLHKNEKLIEKASRYMRYLHDVNGWEWYKCYNAAVAVFGE